MSSTWTRVPGKEYVGDCLQTGRVQVVNSNQLHLRDGQTGTVFYVHVSHVRKTTLEAMKEAGRLPVGRPEKGPESESAEGSTIWLSQESPQEPCAQPVDEILQPTQLPRPAPTIQPAPMGPTNTAPVWVNQPAGPAPPRTLPIDDQPMPIMEKVIHWPVDAVSARQPPEDIDMSAPPPMTEILPQDNFVTQWEERGWNELPTSPQKPHKNQFLGHEDLPHH